MLTWLCIIMDKEIIKTNYRDSGVICVLCHQLALGQYCFFHFEYIFTWTWGKDAYLQWRWKKSSNPWLKCEIPHVSYDLLSYLVRLFLLHGVPFLCADCCVQSGVLCVHSPACCVCTVRRALCVQSGVLCVYSPACSVYAVRRALCAPLPVHTIDHVYLPASVRLVVLNQLDAAEKS